MDNQSNTELKLVMVTQERDRFKEELALIKEKLDLYERHRKSIALGNFIELDRVQEEIRQWEERNT